MNKVKKIWWGVVAVIVVIICWFWFGQRVFIHWQQQRIIAGLEKVKDQYKQDQYGGATPEETLQMFIKAFKARDLTLASKYFVPEKQAEYLAKMQNWVKLGKGEDIIRSLENSKLLGRLKDDSFSADKGDVS